MLPILMTKVDEEILQTVLDALQGSNGGAQKVISRVAFVGLDRRARKLLQQLMNKRKEQIRFLVFCTEDFEKAKEWLITG